jgi:hypothetical protein
MRLYVPTPTKRKERNFFFVCFEEMAAAETQTREKKIHEQETILRFVIYYIEQQRTTLNAGEKKARALG